MTLSYYLISVVSPNVSFVAKSLTVYDNHAYFMFVENHKEIFILLYTYNIIIYTIHSNHCNNNSPILIPQSDLYDCLILTLYPIK